MTRNTHRKTIDEAITMQIAAQGDSKTMKKYIAEISKRATAGLAALANDAKALKKILGKKGGI